MTEINGSKMLSKNKVSLTEAVEQELIGRSNRAVSAGSAFGTRRTHTTGGDSLSGDVGIVFNYEKLALKIEIHLPDAISQGDQFGLCYLTVWEGNKIVLEQYRADSRSQGFYTYQPGNWEQTIDEEFKKIE